MSLIDVFLLLLCMEYVFTIGIFCFEGAEPSSVMVRERERENRGEGTKFWGPVMVISEF